MSTVSIGFVDDHPLMIEGIVTLLSRAQGLEILSTGSTAKDIIDISLRFHPDVIIVDLSMAGDVYAAIATSIKISPNTKIVAFTAATGVNSAIRALDAGANGYVLKGSSAKELIQAVESVRHGETYITQSFASQVIAGLRNASLRRVAAEAVKFSIREDQIVRLLLRGLTNKAIATSLKISEKTVKNYMTILMQKLNARNRLEVVITAQALTEPGSDAPLNRTLAAASALLSEFFGLSSIVQANLGDRRPLDIEHLGIWGCAQLINQRFLTTSNPFNQGCLRPSGLPLTPAILRSVSA